MFSLESHEKPVWWRIKYQGGRDIPFFICNPTPLPLKMIGTKPLKFCLILEMLPVPFEKMKSEGFILVSTFEKFVLLSVGVQILSASFKKKKSEPPYSKTRHQLGGGADTKWNMASLGQTCGDYPTYRQNLGRSAKSKIPDRLGFFPTYGKQALMI